MAPDPPELQTYRDEVWRARRKGAIDAVEAIELLIHPEPRVLAWLAEVGA